MSLLAGGVGLLAGVIAFLLYNLIALVTNLVFYQRFSFAFTSARLHHLGAWVIVVPAIGGIVIGLMAKVRHIEDTRARHSGSDGSGAGEPQPSAAKMLRANIGRLCRLFAADHR